MLPHMKLFVGHRRTNPLVDKAMEGLEHTMAQVSDDIGAIDLSHTVKLCGALDNLRPQSSGQRSSEVPTKSGNVANYGKIGGQERRIASESGYRAGSNQVEESGSSMDDTAGKRPPKRKLDDLQQASGAVRDEDVDTSAAIRRKMEARSRSGVAGGDNTSNELRQKLLARMSVARDTIARNESLSKRSQWKDASSVRVQSDGVPMADVGVEDDLRNRLNVRLGKAGASSIEENPSNAVGLRHRLEDGLSRASLTLSQQHAVTKSGTKEKMLSSGTSPNVATTSGSTKVLATKTSAPAKSAAPARVSITAKPAAAVARMSASAKPAAKTSVIAKTSASSAAVSVLDAPTIYSDRVVSDKVPATSQTGSMPQAR